MELLIVFFMGHLFLKRFLMPNFTPGPVTKVASNFSHQLLIKSVHF
jgi:hypothetical protein